MSFTFQNYNTRNRHTSNYNLDLWEETQYRAKINLDPIICFIDQGNIAINEVNHSLRS